MNKTSQAFLTIFIEAAALPEDPLDSSAATKHLMIDTADRLVDAAVGKMPGYMEAIPQEVRPSAADIAASLRRSYRLKGNKLEVDLAMRQDSLPRAWIDSLNDPQFQANPDRIPWPIRWTARIMGWWMGISQKDRKKVMQEAHAATILHRRNKIEEEICRGMMQMTGAAVEVELHGIMPVIIGQGTVRRVSIWRAF